MFGALGVNYSRTQRLTWDAAGAGRHAAWAGSNTPHDALSGLVGDRIRARARDLGRNDPLAVTALRKLPLAVASTGITPRANTGDKTLDADINAVWDEWERSAPVDSYLGLHGWQVQAIREWLRGGAVLVRARQRRMSDGLPVPLQLEMLTADYLDTNHTTQLPNGNRVVGGVEIDVLGRPAAYHLFRDRPNGAFHASQTRVRVPESVCCHLYEPDEPGQLRGVPLLSPVMVALRDLQLLGDAMRTRAVGEASVLAFVQRPDGWTVDAQDPGKRDADGTVLEELTPGTVSYLEPGETVSQMAPSASGGWNDTRRAEVEQIAAALGLTAAQLTGDLSRVNFSSWRAGQIDHRILVRYMQRNLVVPLLMRRVWVWFLDAAVAAGVLPERARSVERRLVGGHMLTVGYPVRWVYPTFEELDRREEALAFQAVLRAGMSTHAEEWERLGKSPADVEAQLAEAKAMFDRLGISLDSVAWLATASGQVQQPPTMTRMERDGQSVAA